MSDRKYISKVISNGETYHVKDKEIRDSLGQVNGIATLGSDGKVSPSQLPTDIDTTYQFSQSGNSLQVGVNGGAKDTVYTPTITKSTVGLDNVTNDAQVKRTEMGAASGVATLDDNGKVPASQLPSYVDDVLEYADRSSFPQTGETGKIYVDKSTNITWRWGGSDYVEISPSLALGETSSTAYAGDKGKALADKLSGIESGAQVHRAPTTAEVKSALGTGSGTIKYLREDGTWATPPNSQYSFVDNDATLDWSTRSTVATAGGVDIHVTMPSNPNTNTARLQVSDTANKRINTKESTGNYLQFIGGTNKFSVSDGTNTFDVGITPSVSFPVTSVVGQTGGVTVSQIASALTDAGYKLTDTIYSLPAAASNTLGGIKTGYTTDARNYKVSLDSSSNAYVNVPWSDTTYSAGTGISLSGTTFGINSTYQDYISHGNTAYGWGNHANAGYITSSGSCAYAASAGSAGNAGTLNITGYGANGLTFYQTPDEFDGNNNGWCHYIIANHGDGASYYHYTIGLPFSGVPMYHRQNGGTSSVSPWYRFITEENIASQSVNYATTSGTATNSNKLYSGDAHTGADAIGNSVGVHLYRYTGPTDTSIAPVGGDGFILGFNWDGSNGYGAQLYIDTDPTYNISIRQRYGSGEWRSWKQIITENNIGIQSVNYANSAGNADTVDGYHYDGLPYLSNSGGSLWGSITFNGGHVINHLQTIYCAGSDTNHALYFGYGGKDYVTWHEYGNDWRFYYGGSTAERDGYLSVMLGSTNYFQSNVGIGTVAPSYMLDVVGSANATTLYESGTSLSSKYLALSGGTMSGNITMGANAIVFNASTSSTWNTSQNSGIKLLNTVGESSTGAPDNYNIGLSVSGYYTFQLAAYGGGDSLHIYWRNENNTWREIIHSGNIGSQSVNYASSAGLVAWGNVSGRPTNVSSFTNDSGYITSSGSCAYATSAGSAGSATTASQLSGTILPLNANINDYKTTGVYGQLQSNIIATFTGNPSAYRNGEMRLEVVGCGNNSDGYLFQKYWARVGDSWDLYIRSYSADTTNWSDWAKNIDSRNIGSQSVNYANSAGNADTVDGYHASAGSNTPWGTIPVITSTGYMDVGRHFEFHYDNTTGSDYSTALCCTGNYSNIVNLPSSSGTLALTSDIPTTLPASDVYSWAKASSKPSYSWSEISDKPSSMPASDVYSWAKASSKPSYSWSEITNKPTIPSAGEINYYSYSATIDPSYGLNVLVKISSSGGSIYLPTLSSCQTYTGTSGSQKFALIVRIACHTGGQNFTLYGYRGTGYSQYPHVRSGSTADRTSGVGFGAGDTDTYMLTYDGNLYEAYRLCYTE